jgi:galactokinase
MNLTELAGHVANHFQDQYHRPPRWIVAAPGRVNVIGEHTDYNDGFVLPMAIGRYTVMAADFAKAPSNLISIFDSQARATAQIDVSGKVARGDPAWSNYIRGVIAGFQDRQAEIRAMDIALFSTVPMGAGLSSSAALEVCAATLIEAATGHKMDPIEKALLCQKAEHEFAGVPCGIMDQFISVMGRKNNLLLLDCRSRETRLVPVNDPAMAFLIVNTNIKHELSSSEYSVRRRQCEMAARILGVPSLRDAGINDLDKFQIEKDPVIFRRARHVIGEIQRTLDAAKAFENSDWRLAGQLMYESHDSLRDDYEVSCAELDAVVSITKEIGENGGVFGCRMTGGGFGGCAVALVKADKVDFVSDKISTEYKRRTGIEAAIFTSRPESGAQTI